MYSLSALISLTEGKTESDHCYDSVWLDNNLVTIHNGQWYMSITAIYFDTEAYTVVYGDDYTYTINRSENTSGSTYSCRVTASIFEKIHTIKSGSDTEYYWYFSENSYEGYAYDCFFVTEQVDGYATEYFLPRAFYDHFGY